MSGASHSKEVIHDRAQRLRDCFGYVWINDWNWTSFVMGDVGVAGSRNSKLARAGMSAGDLSTSIGADLYVAVLSSPASLGLHMELGARLGANRLAHIVLDGEAHHVLYGHPCAVVHSNWEAFFMYLQGRDVEVYGKTKSAVYKKTASNERA